MSDASPPQPDDPAAVDNPAVESPLPPPGDPVHESLPPSEVATEHEAAGSATDKGTPRCELSFLRIAAAVIVCFAVAWLIDTTVPYRFQLPDQWYDLDPDLASPEQLTELRNAVDSIYRNNGLIQYAILGTAAGFIPVLMLCCIGLRSWWLPAGAAILSGLILGPAAFLAATGVRAYHQDDLVPGGDLGGTLTPALSVMVTAGVIVSLPVLVGMMLVPIAEIRRKASAAPLAGLLAGLLFPVIAAYVLPDEKTGAYPVTSGPVLALWLGVLGACLILLIAGTGERKRRPVTENG